jgi:hypothetical protein
MNRVLVLKVATSLTIQYWLFGVPAGSVFVHLTTEPVVADTMAGSNLSQAALTRTGSCTPSQETSAIPDGTTATGSSFIAFK